MISRTVSRRYAKSLMAVALERGASLEQTLADLENAAVFLAEQPRIRELFTNPLLPMTERLRALERFLAASRRPDSSHSSAGCSDGMCSSWPPAASDSSRMICSTLRSARQPIGE